MSSVEAPIHDVPAPPPPRPQRSRSLSGWGRTRPTRARLLAPEDASALAGLIGGEAPDGGWIARGGGRSYGDPAQNAGGTVIDMTGLSGIEWLDPRLEQVRVGAGTRLGVLLEELAGHGLTLPVLPGTAHVTVGGTIAADVHGKNHPSAGSIGAQLVSFSLCAPAAGAIEVSREEEPEVFAATLGGMGLTGAIAAATLRTIPLRDPYAVADVDRAETLEGAMELLDSDGHTHGIAWLDLLARGRRFGRAVVTRSREGERPAGPSSSLGLEPRPALVVPHGVPGGLLRPAGVRAFNSLLWSRGRRVRERPLDACAQLFPLDRVAGWNRLYGRRGLVQYQFAVPRGEEWLPRCLLEMLRARGLPMYLAALKRFGPGSGGMLSFPIEGWTVAVDIPAGAAGLAQELDRADRMLAAHGGRVYLAKDSRLAPGMPAEMYPQLARWREVRARLDPQGTLRSDMSRRLELSG
jgi:decaprenylphospho-beta-D-ribofuranose 2-oxidase